MEIIFVLQLFVSCIIAVLLLFCLVILLLCLSFLIFLVKKQVRIHEITDKFIEEESDNSIKLMDKIKNKLTTNLTTKFWN